MSVHEFAPLPVRVKGITCRRAYCGASPRVIFVVSSFCGRKALSLRSVVTSSAVSSAQAVCFSRIDPCDEKGLGCHVLSVSD